MNARILPEAEEELAAAAQWYEERQSGLGEEFLAALIESFTAIERHPRRCPLYTLTTASREIRRCSLPRFPYQIYCEVIDQKNLVIVAVGHAHRRPGYWRDRM